MKHILFLYGLILPRLAANSPANFQAIAENLPLFSGVNIPAIRHLSCAPALWEYILIGACMVLVALSLLLLLSNLRLRRRVAAYRHRSADQIRFIRNLLDLCYTYRESPVVFIDKFKDKVNIRELKSYTLIDIPPHRFDTLKEDERLLCQLWESGFTQRELCVIFNLKKVSNLYTKYHRIRNKMKSR